MKNIVDSRDRWGVLAVMLLVLLVGSGVAAAALDNGGKGKVSGQRWQLLDPFSLEMLQAQAAMVASGDGDQRKQLVDVPVRRCPRSPFMPPDGSPSGPLLPWAR
jgi:hypothetical protein